MEDPAHVLWLLARRANGIFQTPDEESVTLSYASAVHVNARQSRIVQEEHEWADGQGERYLLRNDSISASLNHARAMDLMGPVGSPRSAKARLSVLTHAIARSVERCDAAQAAVDSLSQIPAQERPQAGPSRSNRLLNDLYARLSNLPGNSEEDERKLYAILALPGTGRAGYGDLLCVERELDDLEAETVELEATVKVLELQTFRKGIF